MSEECGFIEDGYSLLTTIPRVPGLHPAVTLRFRPATADKRFQWLMANERDVSGADRNKRVAELLSEHLESWNIRNLKGDTVAVKDKEMLKRLQPMLQGKILDLILGYSPVQGEADDSGNSSPGSTS